MLHPKSLMGMCLVECVQWSMWFLRELWRLSDELSHCDCIFYYEQRAFHHALQVRSYKSLNQRNKPVTVKHVSKYILTWAVRLPDPGNIIRHG
jgi:hypothetical protein